MALTASKTCILFRSYFCSQNILRYRRHHAAISQLVSCVHHQAHIRDGMLGTSWSKLSCNPTSADWAPSRRLISTNSSSLSAPIKFVTAKIPKEAELIYNGPLSTMVRLVKFFSLSTSIISSGLLTALCLANDGGILTYVAGGMSSIMILTPIVLHWFTKGYITRLYYDASTKTYTACTYDFFLTDTTMDFTQSDVSLPSVTSVISSFAVRSKPMLIDPRGFTNPNHYSHLMGYTDTEGNLTIEEAKRAFESSGEDPKS